MKRAVVLAQMREAARRNDRAAWDALRRKHRVPMASANTAWNVACYSCTPTVTCKRKP